MWKGVAAELETSNIEVGAVNCEVNVCVNVKPFFSFFYSCVLGTDSILMKYQLFFFILFYVFFQFFFQLFNYSFCHFLYFQ